MSPNLQSPENPLPDDPIKLLKTIAQEGAERHTNGRLGGFVLIARARLKMCARDLEELGHEM